MGVVNAVRRFVSDGLANIVSGSGTGSDKRAYNRYLLNAFSAEDLDAAYRTSWIAKKIHDLPPYDATRAWREWQAEKDDITKFEAEEKRLKIRYKVRRALFLARLFGGSAIVLGVKGNSNPATPLRPDSVGIGGLAYVHVLNRYQLQLGELVQDIADPYFMQPSYYQLNTNNGQQVRVHPSRVIPFIGQPVPEGVNGFAASTFWGDPLWLSLREAVENADFTNNEIASLVHEAKVDVYKIPGLMDNLSTVEYEATFMRRLALGQLGKSNHNALIMDAEEEYEQKQIKFDGLPEVAKIMLLVASGAADIPATRFLGQSPQGMNATGESDLRNYYDSISSKQENEIGPALEPLDDLIIRSALGSRPEDIWYEWASLWQLSDNEKSERDKRNAETVTAYANSGLLPTDALAKGVQNLIIETGFLPGFEDALDESDGQLRIEVSEEREDENAALDLEMKRQQAEAPPQETLRRAANDAAPRTLYVRRDLINKLEFERWAKSQGFDSILTDLHVTIAYSKAEVDWMKAGSVWSDRLTIPAGGARIVEKLGDQGATVLLFGSSELAWRHEEIKNAGASWDYNEYQPHVTVTYNGGNMDLSNIEPYRGKLVFGPEIFEEIDSNASGEERSLKDAAPVVATLDAVQLPKMKKLVIRDENGLITEIREVEDNG